MIDRGFGEEGCGRGRRQGQPGGGDPLRYKLRAVGAGVGLSLSGFFCVGWSS